MNTIQGVPTFEETVVNVTLYNTARHRTTGAVSLWENDLLFLILSTRATRLGKGGGQKSLPGQLLRCVDSESVGDA